MYGLGWLMHCSKQYGNNFLLKFGDNYKENEDREKERYSVSSLSFFSNNPKNMELDSSFSSQNYIKLETTLYSSSYYYDLNYGKRIKDFAGLIDENSRLFREELLERSKPPAVEDSSNLKITFAVADIEPVVDQVPQSENIKSENVVTPSSHLIKTEIKNDLLNTTKSNEILNSESEHQRNLDSTSIVELNKTKVEVRTLRSKFEKSLIIREELHQVEKSVSPDLYMPELRQILQSTSSHINSSTSSNTNSSVSSNINSSTQSNIDSSTSSNKISSTPTHSIVDSSAEFPLNRTSTRSVEKEKSSILLPSPLPPPPPPSSSSSSSSSSSLLLPPPLFPFPFLIPSSLHSDFYKVSYNSNDYSSLPFSLLLYDDIIGFAFLLIEMILGKKPKDYYYNSKSKENKGNSELKSSSGLSTQDNFDSIFKSSMFPNNPSSQSSSPLSSPYFAYNSDKNLLNFVFTNLCKIIPFPFLRF
jgi:hypothetical protein